MTFGQDRSVRYSASSQEVWVVFSGQTDLPWLKILKPGFRHCFALLNDGQRWVTLDPLSNTMELCVHHHVPVDFDLPLWLVQRGLKVVKAKISRYPRSAPFMLFTCVEAIKRILGIHKRFIVTPWQLYRYLTKAGIQETFKQKGDLSWEV